MLCHGALERIERCYRKKDTMSENRLLYIYMGFLPLGWAGIGLRHRGNDIEFLAHYHRLIAKSVR